MHNVVGSDAFSKFFFSALSRQDDMRDFQFEKSRLSDGHSKFSILFIVK